MLNVECLMFKDLEIMKALRYLLMICTLTMAAVTFGQAQFKTRENKAAFDYQVGKTHFDFYSTSTMTGSGSSLPLAARNGLSIGAENPDDNAAAGILAYGPRRAKAEDSLFDDDDIGGTSKPQEPGTPVGDGTWVMLVMAMGFAGWMTLRRRRVMQAKCISKE